MGFVTVTIDASGIRDWDTFHDAFQKAFGYPTFYGRNMNAWIDLTVRFAARSLSAIR